MKKKYIAVLLGALLLGLSWSDAAAHPFGGVIQETYVFPMDSFVLMEYKTHIGREVLLTLNPDINRDMTLSRKEKDDLLEQLSSTLFPNIQANLNGTNQLIFSEIDRSIKMENPDDFMEGINSVFLYRLSLPNDFPKKYILQIKDNNFKAGEIDRLYYYHGIMKDSSGSRLIESGRGLEISFDSSSPPTDKSENLSFEQNPRGTNDKPSESDILSDYFTKGQKGLYVYFLAILGAVVLGAGHALSPGHGKAMVAAYLVGSKGQIHHAVLLGIIVTITHVAVIVLLGIITLTLSKYFLPQDLFPWLGGISGAMIFIIGYWMLASRAINGHTHTHGHHHHHDHQHDLPDQNRISIKGLFSMGIAGGIVPCPSALVVLLVSLSFHRVLEGLGLIFFFSLGLAAVLVLIGTLTVTASKFVNRFSQSKVWIQNLPIFSAGCIMVIGVTIIFNSFLTAGIIQIQW